MTFQDSGVAGGAPSPDASPAEISNTVDLPNFTRALYVGGGGNLKVKMMRGTEVTFASVPTGAVLPICVRRVFATGTTATQIIALY